MTHITEILRVDRTGQNVDDSLRARIRSGDPQAYAELFRANATPVYSYAARLTGDRSAAEDAVSLTFLEAWRLREKLLTDSERRDLVYDADCAHDGAAPDDDLRPWLFGIATNVLRNMQRSARRHNAALARLPGRLADHDTVPDFSGELVGRIEDAERLAAARAALGQLRKREREVFALCVWAELSYADAAEALGVPTSTVRSRLSRARQRLRQLAELELQRRAREFSASGKSLRRL
ncbi:RNA polymerase sigma factor [Streptomyces sp. NBC_00568]|uniref:RNA polymerase sigma factor n=1 Tax=Streptomyces sp. NBC_00568 TaxID=2975779 RepID=UPI002B1D7E0C|nr:RNA polymerase sigma factor [Streptomyces sp. NBC_00568]